MQAALNRARSGARRREREGQALARLAGEAPKTAPEDLADPAVAVTVASLPPQQRAAIYLVYWEDLSPSEAGGVMGIRPGTLRRYLHLARQKLRTHLDE